MISEHRSSKAVHSYGVFQQTNRSNQHCAKKRIISIFRTSEATLRQLPMTVTEEQCSIYLFFFVDGWRYGPSAGTVTHYSEVKSVNILVVTLQGWGVEEALQVLGSFVNMRVSIVGQ